jgi:hypothetical protein
MNHCIGALRYASRPANICSVTSRGHPYAEFQRALERGNVWVAEAVARELPKVSVEDALKLTHLYAEREQWDKFERAAMRFLERYLEEKEPTLQNFAKVVREFEERREDEQSG